MVLDKQNILMCNMKLICTKCFYTDILARETYTACIKTLNSWLLAFSHYYFKVEQDTIRTRIKEVSDLTNELELQIAEIKGENAAMVNLNATEQKAKEVILEAKVALRYILIYIYI